MITNNNQRQAEANLQLAADVARVAWAPVLGWEMFYEVSSDGRVRSTSDYVSIGNGGARRTFKVGPTYMAAAPNGYINVLLQREGRTRRAGVHRLMAEAFYGPPTSESDVARHLDGDRTNNTLANIAWGSPRDNVMDTIRHGRHRKVAQTHCIHGHPFDEANTLWRIRPGHGTGTSRECLACREARNVRRRQQRSGT